jgi:Fe-S-cluster-containing dehydrogenase component/anaerobic selenocysteine-containing dehydrogenase
MSSLEGYWKGYNDLYPEEAAPEPALESPAALNRRRFLAMVTASMAATSACGRLNDRGEIVPYLRQPEETPPGVTRYYASTLLSAPKAPPVLVATREGRPIKLEGNPEHPASRGALGAYGQAATFDLYDPDRLKKPSYNGRPLAWSEIDDLLGDALFHTAGTGKRVLLITRPLVSPTSRKLAGEFLAAHPTCSHLSLESVHDGEVRRGWGAATGWNGVPEVSWEEADVILSLESDFLGEAGAACDQKSFIARRQPDSAGKMSRFWAIEGTLTQTGCNADHRLLLRPALQGGFLIWLLDRLLSARPAALPSELKQTVAEAALDITPSQLGLEERAAQALLSDLLEHPRRSAVVAGPHLPACFHTLVAAVNISLDNIGNSLGPAGLSPAVSPPDQIQRAIAAMAAGEVAIVIDLNANPAFLLPPDAGFSEELARVPLVVCSALFANETTELAHLVLPCAHDLESWGDTDLHAGTLSLQQPVILPLAEARQCEESLLAWLPSGPDGVQSHGEYLKRRWRREVYPRSGSAAGFEKYWHVALHDGLVPVPVEFVPPLRIDPAAIGSAIRAAAAIEPSEWDLILAPSTRLFDGRFANNGWLQELPHPVTTQVWGNGAIMSRTSAARLGCREGDLVRVSVAGNSIDLPAVIEPGVADNVVTVEMGYGREGIGRIGSGIGVDATPLRKGGGLSEWLHTGVAIEARPGKRSVVRTQNHHYLEGRPIVLEYSFQEYRSRPGIVSAAARREKAHAQHSWVYTGHKWGMVVDLTACTGCGSCSLACSVENNIAVVGPEEVARGREMHWLRIDRYYKGKSRNPEVVYQPMLCQQCDAAPCEKVCPVAATVHSPEGIDEMVYNRCVGTRYCANNCPYKVRRFNYFNYLENNLSPAAPARNPEVTLRSRGVMEKCSFCTQRIAEAKHLAKREGRKLRDGELQAACQQACPTDAIVFGDLNDPDSRVHRLAEDPRGFLVLAEVGTAPAVTYLMKIRNPHPDLVV